MNAYYKNSRDKLIAYKGNYEPVKVVDKISYTEKIANGNPSHFKTEYKKSLINLDLKGNTEQKSYEGYNLFDINDIKITGRTEADITTYAPKVENGILYSGGHVGRTSGGMAYIPWDTSKGKAYLSFKAEWDSTETRRIVALTRVASPDLSSTKQAIKQVELSENGGTYLLSGDTQGFPYVAISAYSTTQYGLRISNIQISYEEAPYESYVGGKPSPNVDYPQPINSSSNIELMLSGGNLLNQDLFLENTDVEKIGTAYSFKAYPTTYYKGSNREKLLNQIKSILKPNIKYTIASRFLSRQGGGSNNQGRLQFNDKIGGGKEIFSLTNYGKDQTSLKVVSFTQEQIDNILSVWIFGSNPSVSTTPTIGNIIIINGEYTKDTLPPFDESYIEPTIVTIPVELNKTSDWLDNSVERADSIVVDYTNQTVNFEQKCVKIDLATAITLKDVRIIDTQEFYIGVVRLSTSFSLENGMKAFCTHFVWSYGMLGDYNSFDYSTTGKGTDVYFYNIEQTTAEDFYNFLVENNVQIVGALEKPYTMSLTSTQLGQDLLNLSPKRNQTNVITITSDLPISEQNIKYAKWSVNQ